MRKSCCSVVAREVCFAPVNEEASVEGRLLDDGRMLLSDVVVGPHKISQVRIARLEAAGFEWTDLKRAAWEDKVALLREYIQEYGHTRVPATLDNPKYPKLGSWVKSQRKGYRNEQVIKAGGRPKSKERLQVWQIAMLESIGFEWKGLQASAWESKFALLQQYVREKGNARVPVSFDFSDPCILAWLSD